MCWTNMDAIDPDGVVFSRDHLREMYSAYRWFPGHTLFSDSMALRAITPGLADLVGDRNVYFGDIYSQMVMGNLVHTSTVMLRRDRLERVGGFNLDLKFAGEDYDYHLRTCREGPVAYVDVSAILYLRGRADQLTRPAYSIHLAQNFLKTITSAIARDRDRIVLPKGMLDEVLAEAHAWVAGELVKNERDAEAVKHYAISLAHRPMQSRLYPTMALAMMPRPLSRALRGAWRRLRRATRSPGG
jgi:hypothetical protein